MAPIITEPGRSWPVTRGASCARLAARPRGGARLTFMSSAVPSPARPSSRWRFVITPRWLAWHAFTVAAVIGMLWLGDWQFHRAMDGNALSWAYTFEWPVFAIFGVVFWAKTILDEGKPGPRPMAAAAPAPAAPGTAGLDLPGAGGPAAAAA